jgi:iron complex outermembrane receptor protein
MKFTHYLIPFAALAANAPSVYAQDNNNIESIEVIGRVNSFANQSEIQLNHASSPDLRSQLQLLPGVNVNGNGAVSGVVQYRGLFGDRVRVNIDGAEVAGAGPNAMDSPLSHDIGSLYQTVTLHQGIAPVSAGAETLGGAIEINEYDFDINESADWLTQGGATASYFTNDNRALSALIFSSANNMYFGLSGDVQEGDNYDDGAGRQVPSTFYERNAIKLKAGAQLGKHRIDASVAKRNTNESGTPALAMDIIFVDALWYRLNHEFDAGNDWSIQTQIFGNQNQHDMNNYELRTPPMPAMFRLNSVDSEASGINSHAIYSGDDKVFEVGGELYQREHQSYITNPNNPMFFINNFNNVERDRVSLYGEYTQRAESYQWQLGARISEVSADADPVSTNMAMMNPNVATLQNDFNAADRNKSFNLADVVAKLNIPVSSAWSATVSAAIKDRAPTYSELYSWFPLGVSAGLADGRNYIGNLDLEKETAMKVDVGVQYHNKSSAISASVFHSKVDDYILGTPSTNQAANNIAMMNSIAPPLQWNNTDAKLSGVELNALTALGEAWQVSAGLEYVRAKQTSPVKQDLYRVAPLSGHIQVDYTGNDWSWRLSSRLIAAQNKVAEQQNETPTSGYVIINTDVVYEVTQQFQVSIIAENLLDIEYADHLAGVNRINDSEIAKGDKVPGAGRNVGVYMQYQF